MIRAAISETWHYVKALNDSISEHEIIDRSAQVAYFLLLSVFPFLVALLGLLAQFNLAEEVNLLEDLIREALPGMLADALVTEIQSIAFAETGGRIIVGFGLGLYATHRAVHALILGVNKAWNTREDRNFMIVRGIAIAMSVGAMLGVMLLLVGLALGDFALENIQARGWVSASVTSWIRILRWPTVFTLGHFAVNAVYRVGANTPLRWRWSTWGSVFATVSWVVIFEGFHLYVNNVTDLGATYGSLGAAAGLLILFYSLVSAVFIGAEIDALNYARRDIRRARRAAWKRSRNPEPEDADLESQH
ncbi:MAG: YihY/virulence factor BrkB family protein [Myxococcota bacterium]|nr:YihY/virulence factor BrkB family protein [Myxococcota bacterium]